jgi:hypothetical protein
MVYQALQDGPKTIWYLMAATGVGKADITARLNYMIKKHQVINLRNNTYAIPSLNLLYHENEQTEAASNRPPQ